MLNSTHLTWLLLLVKRAYGVYMKFVIYRNHGQAVFSILQPGKMHLMGIINIKHFRKSIYHFVIWRYEEYWYSYIIITIIIIVYYCYCLCMCSLSSSVLDYFVTDVLDCWVSSEQIKNLICSRSSVFMGYPPALHKIKSPNSWSKPNKSNVR